MSLAVLVGGITGIFSGMGIGGGTLLILYLTAVSGQTPYEAAAVNLIYFLACAPAALWFHAKGGRLDRRIAIAAAIGGCLTAVLSAAITPQDTPDWLRRLFGGLLLAVAAREMWKLFHSEKKSG